MSSWDKKIYSKPLIEEVITSTAVSANAYGVIYSFLFNE